MSADLKTQSKRASYHQSNTGSLLAAGVSPSFIAQKQGQWNQHINPEERTALQSQWEQSGQVGGVEALKDTKHDWDPNKYLPGIQQQSGAIYDPQQAQLKALQELSASQSSETRMKTQEEFDTRMQAEQESMNRRGAYFSGGAIRGEQDIRNEQMRILNQQDLQAQAGAQESLAQQGQLGYAKTQFEQQALFDQEAGANSGRSCLNSHVPVPTSPRLTRG